MYKMDRNSLKSNPAAHGLGGIQALNICMLKSVGSLQSLVEFNLGPPNTNPTTSGHGPRGVLPYRGQIGTVCAAVKGMVFKQFTLA